MARIKHIALTTKNPDQVAAFYRDGLGLKEIRRSPSGAVFLTGSPRRTVSMSPWLPADTATSK